MKQKVIIKIENWSNKDGMLLLNAKEYSVRCLINNIVSFCNEKKSGFIQCEFSPPYKKRTTGKDSQNSHIWGHIQQIANETGNDLIDIEDEIKIRAVKRGYPYHINKLNGKLMPNSMTKINTVEAGYLIDELHQLASELEIVLVED